MPFDSGMPTGAPVVRAAVLFLVLSLLSCGCIGFGPQDIDIIEPECPEAGAEVCPPPVVCSTPCVAPRSCGGGSIENGCGVTYHLSPDGSDDNNGLSEQEPWGTLAHAWSRIRPGDALSLGSGIYTEVLQPTMSGDATSPPVAVFAVDDGAVIFDGEGLRIPCHIFRWWPAV
ncbi:MAG: hypothetical protein R3C68_02340 [Myxococcota bacterium]